MTINLQMPNIAELKPKIVVYGVGGAGGNAVNNMIATGLEGVDFVVANTDAQALATSRAEKIVQMGVAVTEGLGAGSQPEIGRAAAEEAIDEICDFLNGAHMVFITAGMGGGTGTGAAPVVARAAKEMDILTVGVVTKPFQFEGNRRMRIAEAGIEELQKQVDTLIVIPNQNLFRVANENTTFADAFAMADEVLHSGVACITDLMVKEGLINLDFADVRSVMREMGKAMMGTGEATGEDRALKAAEAAISNPLLDDVSMQGAKGLLVSITGGRDMTLHELDQAANRIRDEVDDEANIIVGATYDDSLEGTIRVSVVATGLDLGVAAKVSPSVSTDVLRSGHRQPMKATSSQGALSKNSVPHERDVVSLSVEKVAQAAPLESVSARSQGEVATNRLPESLQVSRYQPVARDESFDEAPKSFIPPRAVAPEVPPVRMPKIEDLPRPVQQQVERQNSLGASVAAHHEEVQDTRPGLMQRLVGMSFGRRDESVDASHVGGAHRHGHSAQLADSAVDDVRAERQVLDQSDFEHDHREIGAPAVRVSSDDASQWGGASQGVPSLEDEAIDLPAFLRRKA